MFERAERKKVYLKLAEDGPSGSGKTLGALLIAKGFTSHLPPRKELHPDGKQKSWVAMIDSENDSAALYANHPLLKGFTFDRVVIRPPFTVNKYQAAFDAAVKQGYFMVVADSVSHVWAGEGGLMEKKDSSDKRGMGGWIQVTKEHEQFKSSFLQAPIHCILTMRSKTEYLVTEDDKGKQKITKAGRAPIQRPEFEYEFTVMLSYAMDHTAIPSKNRTTIFKTGETIKVTEQTGIDLYNWTQEGEEPTNAAEVKEPSNRPHEQTNQRPPNNYQKNTNTQPQNRQQNTGPQPNPNQPKSTSLISRKYWDENPLKFEDSIIKFGQYNGKMFKDIGHAELNNALQYAINNADPKSPVPKEFSDLAKFVQNWHESIMEAEVADSFTPAAPTEPEFAIAEPNSQ